MKENDNTRGELHIRIEELQEQCEVMEFRTLELEEYNEKVGLIEHRRATRAV